MGLRPAAEREGQLASVTVTVWICTVEAEYPEFGADVTVWSTEEKARAYGVAATTPQRRYQWSFTVEPAEIDNPDG